MRAVIAQEVIDDDRALAVRQENDAVIALVLHEVFENEIEPPLDALPSQAPEPRSETPTE